MHMQLVKNQREIPLGLSGLTLLQHFVVLRGFSLLSGCSHRDVGSPNHHIQFSGKKSCPGVSARTVAQAVRNSEIN